MQSILTEVFAASDDASNHLGGKLIGKSVLNFVDDDRPMSNLCWPKEVFVDPKNEGAG
jgi:hypothetical protein